jgi:hypothetical protein
MWSEVGGTYMLVNEENGDIFSFGELLESRLDDAGLCLCCTVSSSFFVLELSLA